MALLMGAVLIVGCGRAARPANGARATPAPAARSVLLITVDTLRADRLGCYGDTRARTPRIDALAAAGTVFERAFTPVPITLPAHASLFTGLIPPAHGVRGNGAFALATGVATLAEALSAAGRSTAAFVGGFPLARRFGLDRGFGHYDDRMGKPSGVHYEFAERRADAVVDAAIAWLARSRATCSSGSICSIPHAPVRPAAGVRGRRSLSRRDRRRRCRRRPPPRRVGNAAGARRRRADRRSRRGLRRTRRGEPQPVRVRRHVARPAGPEGQRRARAPAARRRCRSWTSARPLLALAGAPARLPGDQPAGPRGRGPAPLRRDARAAARLRLERPAGDPRRPPQAHPRAAAGAVRRRGRSRARCVTSPPRSPETLRGSPRPSTPSCSAAGEAQTRRPVDPETTERLRSLGYVQGLGEGGTGADPKDKVEVALPDRARRRSLPRPCRGRRGLPRDRRPRSRRAGRELPPRRRAAAVGPRRGVDPVLPEGARGVAADGRPVRGTGHRAGRAGPAGRCGARAHRSPSCRSRQRPGALQPRGDRPRARATARPPAARTRPRFLDPITRERAEARLAALR